MVAERPEDLVGIIVALAVRAYLFVRQNLIDRGPPEVAVRDFAVLVQAQRNLPNIPRVRRRAVPRRDLVGQRRLAVDEVFRRLSARGGRVGIDVGCDPAVEEVVGEGDGFSDGADRKPGASPLRRSDSRQSILTLGTGSTPLRLNRHLFSVSASLRRRVSF